jgi:hypothetical protein
MRVLVLYTGRRRRTQHGRSFVLCGFLLWRRCLVVIPGKASFLRIHDILQWLDCTLHRHWSCTLLLRAVNPADLKGSSPGGILDGSELVCDCQSKQMAADTSPGTLTCGVIDFLCDDSHWSGNTRSRNTSEEGLSQQVLSFGL